MQAIAPPSPLAKQFSAGRRRDWRGDGSQEQALRAHRQQSAALLRAAGCRDCPANGEWFVGTSLAEDWHDDLGDMFGLDSEIPLMRSSSPALVVEEVEVDLVEPVRADREIVAVRTASPVQTAKVHTCSRRHRVRSPSPYTVRRSVHTVRKQRESDFDMAQRLQREVFGLRSSRRR